MKIILYLIFEEENYYRCFLDNIIKIEKKVVEG